MAAGLTKTSPGAATAGVKKSVTSHDVSATEVLARPTTALPRKSAAPQNLKPLGVASTIQKQ